MTGDDPGRTGDASCCGGSDLPALELTLTDTGFEIAQPLQAGRYQITATNSGTSAESHFALGKIPDDVTDAQYEAFLAAMDDTEDLSFEEIAFVGVPIGRHPGARLGCHRPGSREIPTDRPH